MDVETREQKTQGMSYWGGDIGEQWNDRKEMEMILVRRCEAGETE